MRVALSIEALDAGLTGVGRYTWELVRHLGVAGEIGDLRCYRAARWVSDPAAWLAASPPRPRWSAPRWMRDIRMRGAMRKRLFHGTNFFLPRGIEGGIVTVHDLSVFRYPETHPLERVRHFEKAFASSLKRAAHVITCTEAVRDELIGFAGLPPERVTAIALGVSPSFRPMPGPELLPVLNRHGLSAGCYALCVSTLEPRKRIGALIRAWEALPDAVRSCWPLILAGGRGWLSEDIEAAIARGTAEGWVRHLGYVDDRELPQLYAGAALFVYPSQYEGFGLPPIEAMASGVPTVISTAAALREIAKGAALEADPDDIDAFSATLLRALTDNRWRSRAVREGRGVAASYSWKECARRTVDVYRAVGAGRMKEICE